MDIDREQKQATLILHGWYAVEVHHRALIAWGISHPMYGSIHEDMWHKTKGPSTAPLKSSVYAIHVFEPHRECSFDRIPGLCFQRLWDAVSMGVWSGS